MNSVRKVAGENFVLLCNDSCPGKKIGIYARGGCDLKLLYGLAPIIRRHGFSGSVCILKEGVIADARSDIVLQTLTSYPDELVQTVIQKLHLDRAYFKPQLFEPTFHVPDGEELVEFPKTVVLMSIGPDIVRTVYRHRTDGYLVDPGGGWLNQSMQKVLDDLSAVEWFRKNFQSIGMISLDESVANFTRIIQRVQAKTGGHVLVFNTLTLEPGSRVHNYQFVKDGYLKRRLEFNLALAEMSRNLDFSIIDLDRVLKKAGTEKLVDFGHIPPEFNPLLSQEVFRILKDRGLFDDMDSSYDTPAPHMYLPHASAHSRVTGA